MHQRIQLQHRIGVFWRLIGVSGYFAFFASQPTTFGDPAIFMRLSMSIRKRIIKAVQVAAQHV